MTILEQITENKRKEVEMAASIASISDLERSSMFRSSTQSLVSSLKAPGKCGIIAEFKRRSPSKGVINNTAIVTDVTNGYFNEGASAISILTDNRYFGGANADLIKARHNTSFPILRKDFTVTEYQVIEARAIGADAILLIAAILTGDEVRNLAKLARSVGMETLLEIHSHDELEKINEYVDMVGVNNRDLKTFKVDIEISERLCNEIPDRFVKISESGISQPEHIRQLKAAGYDGFLIGERFMATSDPVGAFSSFVKSLKEL